MYVFEGSQCMFLCRINISLIIPNYHQILSLVLCYTSIRQTESKTDPKLDNLLTNACLKFAGCRT